MILSIKHKDILPHLMAFYVLLVSIGCDSENANDCIQSAGTIIEQQVEVASFDRILVERNLHLVFMQEQQQKVIIKTGANLLPDIKLQVVDGQLQLRNENECNFFRDYGLTTIYVSSPDIVEIRSATQGDVRSSGRITVDKLRVYSENYRNNEYLTSGEFYLDLQVNEFQLVFNGVSNMHVQGQAKQLNITMASGNGRFEGRDFEVENAQIYHRSSNDVIVNVTGHLKADLYGTGDLIAVRPPATQQVKEHYKGNYIIE